MWILIDGFDKSNNIDWDSTSRPIEFTQSQSDPNSKADLYIADPGSQLNFIAGQEVIVWDESTPPEPTGGGGSVAATPSHNFFVSVLNFSDTTNWTAAGNIGTIARGSTSFTITFTNNDTSFTNLQQKTLYGYVHPGQSYMLSAYISAPAPSTVYVPRVFGGTLILAIPGVSNINYQLQLQFLDAGGNNLGSPTSVTGVPGAQARISVSAVAPAGAVYVQGLIGAVATVNGTNSGTVTFGTPQLEGMWFTGQGVSYPTSDCNAAQVDCTLMPDLTVSRTARIFSGYIDNFIKRYDGPNRIWELSLAAASDVLEKGANNLINYSASNRFDDLIISDIVTTYFSGIVSIAPANNFAPNPVVRGVSIGSVSWNDLSFRDALNALCDQSDYSYRANEYYSLEYHPRIYNPASFNVVASASADGVTNIAPEDYSFEGDITQRKLAIKVIGAPYTAPFFTDTFSGNGSITQFTLTQIPHEVRSITVGGVQQVAGINGLNALGDVISAGTITVLVDQAGHFLKFQTAPPNAANNVKCEYNYKGPISVQVLAQVSKPLAPSYATPLFWTKVHDSSIASLAAATERGLQELTRFVNQRSILKFKTFKWTPPGAVIYFTSALDNLTNQPYQVQKVTGRLLGSGVNQYELEIGDYVQDLTSHLRLNHRAHHRSTYTANVTLPQTTDLMFSDVMYYSESVVIATKTASTGTYGGAIWGSFTWA